jgi:formamidopyrimidine-DNA glycosylase
MGAGYPTGGFCEHIKELKMPELPEIVARAREMQALVGKTIVDIEVLQPKCLNISVETFVESLNGAQILDVGHRGKWVIVETSQGWLLLGLGMGGEILLVTRDTLPEKWRLIFDFADGTCLAVNFWWFGYAHYVRDLADHSMTVDLGPDAWGLTLDEFRELLQGRRGGIKSFLLNQKRIAGIGNVYAQDPLFAAGIHPLRSINSLSNEEIEVLWRSIQGMLQESIDLGGTYWEQNLYGERGGWGEGHFLVAYREGKPCPKCGAVIEKIKTGSTSTHICPVCQSFG